MMLGALTKTYYADVLKIDPKKVYTVSVMPCTAKKFEISREEMTNNGVPNVDAVITTRELGQMITQAGINFRALEETYFDSPMGQSTGAADIFGVTGGVMEAAVRTVYAIITGRQLPFADLHITPITGLDQIKEATLQITDTLPDYKMFENFELKIAVTSGLAGAKILMEQITEGKSPYHFIEVMGCPSGCICGGGQPRSDDHDTRIKRMQAIYSEDEGKNIRQSHLNSSVQAIYSEFIGEPGNKKAHELLHTHYVDRS
jgi:NADH-quinone oxidoreductase subunit G/NADP-reducing hydrogenase subunit HndD